MNDELRRAMCTLLESQGSTWDQDPRLYLITAEHQLRRLPLPPELEETLWKAMHPRHGLRVLAQGMELPEFRALWPGNPDERHVGVALFMEMFSVQWNPASGQPRPKGDFSQRSDAVEKRALMAHMRDGTRLGAEQARGEHTARIVEARLVPGTAAPSMLHSLERISRSLLEPRPPAAFRPS